MDYEDLLLRESFSPRKARVSVYVSLAVSPNKSQAIDGSLMAKGSGDGTHNHKAW